MASRPGVKCLGYMDDIESVYRAARFFVNPVLAGTGQSIKTAESMAFGLPVIAFEALAQDSPLVHGESGLVARTIDEFADHTVRLWMSTDDCRRWEHGRDSRSTNGATSRRTTVCSPGH